MGSTQSTWMDSDSSSSSSSSSSSNIDSSTDSEVRFKSSAIIAEFKRNKKSKKNKKKQKKKKRHRSKSSIGDLDVSNYSKKLLDRNKTPKVTLDKCEADNHLLKIGTKTNDNATANLLRSFPLESDSEYETEEVYELSEWYPPDFWKSNQFMETLNQQVDDALSGGTSNLNHLRNAKEDGN